MRDIKVNLSTSETNNVGQIVVRQDDKDTQKIIACIHENGEPKNLAGYTVFFNARIKDGIIARDLAQVTGKSQVSYVLKEAFYQKTGRIDGFFSFEKDGNRESTANFAYHVTPGVCRDIRQGNYIYELEQLIKISGEIVGSEDLSPLIRRISEVDSKTESYREATKEEMATLEKALKLSLKDHADDKENPHGVTAKQTGAYTKEEINEFLKTNGQIIFDGAVLWNEEQKFKYDYSKLKVGVQLVFSRYDVENWQILDYGFNTVTILKETIKSHNGYQFYAGMPDLKNPGVVKKFRFNDFQFWGDASNMDVGAYALRKIIGF